MSLTIGSERTNDHRVVALHPHPTYLKLSRTDPQSSVTKMTKHHIFWSYRIRRIDIRCLGFRVADTILRPVLGGFEPAVVCVAF